MGPLGVQIIADLYDCDRDILNSEEAIRDCIVEAARHAKATVVAHCFHRFSPHGVSGVVVIAESHLAIHTWPEHGYAALDLFTCGDTLDSEACFSYVKEKLGSQRQTMTTVERGLRHQLEKKEPAK